MEALIEGQNRALQKAVMQAASRLRARPSTAAYTASVSRHAIPRATRVRDRRSVAGIARTKRIFIALMRLEKSLSPIGKVTMQCMCSGSTTHASM